MTAALTSTGAIIPVQSLGSITRSFNVRHSLVALLSLREVTPTHCASGTFGPMSM